MRTFGLFIGIILGIAVCATPVSATLVSADFNDLTGGGANLSGQAGGTGLDGSWAGSVWVDVIAGDLTAPGSTGYALTQSSGTPQSIVSDDTTNVRGIHRVLTTPLTGNTIWISYLMQDDDDSRSGLMFNGSTAIRVFTLSSNGRLYIDSGSSSTFTASGITEDVAALILCKITVDDSGNDTWEVWVDPDVSNGPGGLGSPTHSNGAANSWDAAGLHTIGIYEQGEGQVDMLYMSDGPDAFSDVTGYTGNSRLVIADFNDLNGSAGGVDIGGQAGGAYLSGNWAGSTSAHVVDNNLTAPVGLGYALTQTGNARSFRADSSAARGGHRAFDAAHTGNTIWFSYLMQDTANAGSASGLTFNYAGATPAGNNSIRVYSYDSKIYIDPDISGANETSVASGITDTETALILCKITVNDAGNDTWEVWVNPYVAHGEAGLGTATLTNGGGNSWDTGGLVRTGPFANFDGQVDMLYISDGTNGFADVTGVTGDTLVIADFNDLSGSAGGVDIGGQAGGTGFTGNWAGSTSAHVVDGNLTAPAGLGYALTQTNGTAQSFRADSTAARGGHRVLTAALIRNTIWFSYLMRDTTHADSASGLAFNYAGATPDTAKPIRVYSYNNNIYIDPEDGTDANQTSVASGITDTETALILCKITVNDTGNDTWEVWVNPDVSNGPSGLGTATLTNGGGNSWDTGGLVRTGPFANFDGQIDMLYMSDDEATGFADVTGYVPPPVGTMISIR